MKEEILQMIKEISQQKEDAKKFPVIVLDNELRQALKKRVLQVLRQLFKEEKVDFGRTVNNNFVEIRTSKEKRNRKIIIHDIN